MLAIRTSLLKQAMPEFLNEYFIGVHCVTGDDRYLTSWLLKNGYKTVYQPACKVLTDAPDTLGKFVKQRLRWSRSNLRETLLSFSWVFKYPYTAFTVITDIVMRWFFFVVILTAVLSLFGIIHRVHFLEFSTLETLVYVAGGFTVSGLLRQIPHLRRKPADLKYLPAFLLITTFVLTAVELYGNVTCWQNGWLTRDTKARG